MNDFNTTQPKKLSLRRLIVLISVVALTVTTALVTGLWYIASTLFSQPMSRDSHCCWREGVTFAWMREVIGVQVPDSATDRRAAYKTSSMYDTGLLVFTLPSAEAERYLVALNPSGEVTLPNKKPKKKGYKRADTFEKLGLAEPETIPEARLGGFCHGDLHTPEGKGAHYCTKLFAHEYTPGSTRIYLRTTIEPGVPPPPTAPTTDGSSGTPTPSPTGRASGRNGDTR
ncbi:hypothetical protein [Streptomyces sp. URMC 123]|uniref:hypothetical protein n=1 Tax=Streptomyces sp. URMC 123 TaxID=3423403 RepID=UPI003F1B8A98